MNSILSKIKNCSHKIVKEKLIIKIRAYFHCYKCGKLIIVKDLKIYESLNKGKFEFNPIKMINQMILKQKKEIKIIKDKFNNNNNIINQNNIYVKNRDIFIFYLKQFCNKLNYSERVFYHCLYLLDSYLIQILKKEISKRTIILITLGFFLISSKFIEIDIFEPNINQFCKIEKDIVISQKEILNMEIKCLQLIDYNILNYSTYDWLEILNKVGIIFNTQTINLKIEQIYEKQKYLLKRIINYDLLYKYNSFQLALSIINITLDNFFSINKINKDLFELFLSIFNYKYSFYEKCYNDIKNHIFNYNKYNNDKDDCKQIENYNKTEYSKRNLINCYNQSVENILKHPIKFSNKLNSKNIKINELLFKNKIKSEKIINMLKNKNRTESEEKNNIKYYKNSNEINSLILPKDKILFKKERQHLTIDCNNSSYNNNCERIPNNKLNYNNLINYLLNKTKKNSYSFHDLFNKRKFLIINKNSSRNMAYNYNNEMNKNSAGNIFNINNNNDLKKSLSSISNNSPFKKKEQIIKNSTQLFNFDDLKNKNILKKLNISSNKNVLEKNKSLKTLYNKNQIKSYILKNDSFFSSANDKNIFLRNNNNFVNTNNKKSIIINKEIIPSLKCGILNVSNYQF